MNALIGNKGTSGPSGPSGNNDTVVNGVDLVKLAERFGHYFIENITAISIVVVLMIGALVYMQLRNVQFGPDITENVNIANNSMNNNNPNSKTVIIETFDSMDQPPQSSGESLDAKLKAGFCKSHLGKPDELEKECGKLSKHSCTATSCCAWARMDSTESCVSGNKHGPIFKHRSDGAPKTLDYYYFENKCKGNCPTEK
jgi:hypothetical protein